MHASTVVRAVRRLPRMGSKTGSAKKPSPRPRPRPRPKKHPELPPEEAEYLERYRRNPPSYIREYFRSTVLIPATISTFAVIGALIVAYRLDAFDLRGSSDEWKYQPPQESQEQK